MFDSRIDLVGNSPGAETIAEAAGTSEYYQASTKLTDEIQTLEQQLIDRTTRVLQNTDMLREF